MDNKILKPFKPNFGTLLKPKIYVPSNPLIVKNKPLSTSLTSSEIIDKIQNSEGANNIFGFIFHIYDDTCYIPGDLVEDYDVLNSELTNEYCDEIGFLYVDLLFKSLSFINEDKLRYIISKHLKNDKEILGEIFHSVRSLIYSDKYNLEMIGRLFLEGKLEDLGEHVINSNIFEKVLNSIDIYEVACDLFVGYKGEVYYRFEHNGIKYISYLQG